MPTCYSNKLKNQLFYKAKYRGCLETELILSGFAVKYLSTMCELALQEFNLILEQDDVHLYNILTTKIPVPDYLQNGVMAKLLQFKIHD